MTAPYRLAGFVLVLPMLAGPGAAAAGGSDAAIQLLADVTLIDGLCQNTTVRFGAAFKIAASDGLAIADVLPGGRLRRRFEAALQSRTAETPREELCGALATDYAAAVPGLVSHP